MTPFFVTVPHSGEFIPKEADWLKNVAPQTFLRDVDRFVDKLYEPAIAKIKSIRGDIHRYVVDLNRLPEDVDQDSVKDSKNPTGSFTTGYHWVKTTLGEVLMHQPISKELHQQLTTDYFLPFHNQIKQAFKQFKEQGHKDIYHLDAHSMPSKGTSAHRDQGDVRPQIVVSDQDGKSCSEKFKDSVIRAYEDAGFQVFYNWPYKGGRITQTYGQPHLGQHTIQVEMNRSLYMNEETKERLEQKFSAVQTQLQSAISQIVLALV